MIWKIDRKERNGLKEFSDSEFNHKGHKGHIER